MAKEPSEGACILTETGADPLLRCVSVFRPIGDRAITPNIIMVDAVRIGFKRGVYTEILLHELVLKEETSITEVARDDRGMSLDVSDVLDFEALREPEGAKVIRHVLRPNFEQV